MHKIREILPALRAAGLLAAASGLFLAPRDAQAACTDAANVRTCVPPEDVARPHTWSLAGDPGSVHTVDIDGTVGLPALAIPVGINFESTGVSSQDLLLTIDGLAAIGAGVVTFSTDLITVFNPDGQNQVLIGQGVALTLAMTPPTGGNGVAMLSNISLGDSTPTPGAGSLTRFDGTILLTAIDKLDSQGIVTFVGGGSPGFARTELQQHASVTLTTNRGAQGVATFGNATGFGASTDIAAGAAVNVTSGGGYGVFTRGQAAATLTSLGNVTVTGSDGLLPFAGYYVEAQQGPASATIGGALTLNAGGQSTGSAYGAYVLSQLTTDLAALTFTGTLLANAPGVVGLRAEQTDGGAATVDARTGTLTVQGAGSTAIQALTTTGTATILSGAVSANGTDAPTLFASSTGGAVAVDTRSGAITTSGANANAVEARAATGFALQAGAITTSGANAAALFAHTAAGAGTAAVAGALAASGNDSSGVWLKSDTGAVTLDVALGASVTGGYDADAAVIPAGTQVNAAGIALGAGTGFLATLNNAGSIGAASDRALTALAGAGAFAVNNSGTLTGTVALGGGDDLFTNTGTWALRNAADSNGDGSRDTKRIATQVFGAGNDTFLNEAAGVLRLQHVAGAATTVIDGQYLPDLMPIAGYATTTAGVEQAHFVQLERFEHRGTITLRDADAGVGGAAPVAGDVLLMTSGTVSTAGTLTAGAAPLVFLADGGTLALDTEMNQGGAQSHSDMLVVDSVQLGPNGPTRVVITPAGGIGGPTIGSGIKVVDVLGGGTLSANGAFVMTGLPFGAFTYNLFRSGTVGDDGDWYLRTEAAPTPPDPPPVPQPGPPDPGPTPPDPPLPTYRPEAALFAGLPGFLRNIDAAAPGTRAARLGDEAGGQMVARRGRAWGRYISKDIDTVQAGTVAPQVAGDTQGFQLGVELFGGKDEAAAQIGVYGGQLQASGEVRGVSNGQANALVGALEPTLTYAGVYVSRARGKGLYFDAVLQYGLYGGEALTYADGVVAQIEGTGGYASLETGYGFALSRVVLEPQLQIVAQPQRVHQIEILNAQVSQNPANTLAARVGLRVKGELGNQQWRFQPYLAASIWQGLDHSDRTVFSGDGTLETTLYTQSQLQALEFAGGFSLGMGSRVMAFAEYASLVSRGDASMKNDGSSLTAGVRFAW